MTTRPRDSRFASPGFLAKPFARFIFRYKSAVQVAAILFTAVCAVALVPYLGDPFEFNFNKLRNKINTQSGSARIGSHVDRLFTQRLDPMFVLADRVDQVPLIVSAIQHTSEIGRAHV